ncbi:hypothetical protein TNCV_4763331 [Trichonephila clavipes]|nr:hypothetical protein TNCV_4763331 [Trichonephila clavipes]
MTLTLKNKFVDQTPLAVLCQVPREANPQYAVTDPRRHIADPVSRQAVGGRKAKESDHPRRGRHLISDDAILKKEFFNLSECSEATQALKISLTWGIIIRHKGCLFRYHENPPTLSGVEPATLVAQALAGSATVAHDVRLP